MNASLYQCFVVFRICHEEHFPFMKAIDTLGRCLFWIGVGIDS